MSRYIEKKTGVLYGTYRWGSSEQYGQPPLIGFVLRPPGGFVRMEFVFRGRAFYLTWGHEA